MTPEDKDAFLQLLDRLTETDQAAVRSFAEFLLSRGGGVPVAGRLAPEPVEIPPPVEIQRPEDERVVAAVKRLSKTYFMLDKKRMLSATSDLVTQHVLQGREAADVIDELEALFEDQYRQLKESGQS